jgi:hypothetical protein
MWRKHYAFKRTTERCMMDNFNFRILNMDGEAERAVAQFMYKGYEISMSKIFDNIPVAVYGNNDLVGEHYTVQDAIEWVDAQL